MSTIKLDRLYTHSKNLSQGYTENGALSSEVKATFCGSPIVTLDSRATDIDYLLDIDRTIAGNKAFASVEPTVMPGEIICNDGVVRRDTSAEAVGYDKYHAFELPKGLQRVSIALARLASLAGRLVHWRMDGVVGTEEFAMVNAKEEL